MEAGLIIEDTENPHPHHSAKHQANGDVCYQRLPVTFLMTNLLSTKMMNINATI